MVSFFQEWTSLLAATFPGATCSETRAKSEHTRGSGSATSPIDPMWLLSARVPLDTLRPLRPLLGGGWQSEASDVNEASRANKADKRSKVEHSCGAGLCPLSSVFILTAAAGPGPDRVQKKLSFPVCSANRGETN